MEKRNIEELIADAKLFFETYKKEIGESRRKGRRVLFINFEDLSEHSPDLAEEILANPVENVQLLETALDETELGLKNTRIRLNSLPETQKVKIRTIRAQHLNQLIYFEGIIRQASDVRPQVVNAKFECPACGTVISVLQIEKKFREPSRCSCGRKGQFRLISKIMVDAQRLVIEEAPESLSGGEQPRRMTVFLKEDLVEPIMEEKTTPGSKVKVLGILTEVPLPLPTGSISTRFDLAVEANNVIPLESSYEELEINEEDERQIQELSCDPEVFKKLRDSVAPSIYGYDEIKEALVLQMFGGVRKVSPDMTTTRGDIHLFLIGDPGVAKSIGKDEKIIYISKENIGKDTIENIFKKYKKYPKDLKVLTIDQNTQEPKWETVGEIIKHLPEKDLIRVKTEHGRELKATKDHSFISLSKKGDIVPIKGEELTTKSYLPIPINYHKKLFEYFYPGFFNKKQSNNCKLLPNKIRLTKEFGFFIGIFLAEGYIKNGRTIEISNKNEEIQKRVIEFLKTLNLSFCVNTDSVSIFSKNLADILYAYCYEKEDLKSVNKGIKGNYSRIKKIPAWMFFSPKEFIYGIISGLFSGDGRLIKDKKMLKGFELISVSKYLVEDTSDLLFSIGILNKIKKRSYIYKNNKTDYYSLSIPTYMIEDFSKNIEILGRKIIFNKNKPVYSYNNLIPCGELVYELVKKLGYNSRISGNRVLASEMRTVKKRGVIGRLRLLKLISEVEGKTKVKVKELEILKKIAYSNIIWSKITNIELLKKKNEEVYDLSIPSTNTFVANGIGVHNSVTLKFISNIAPRGRYIVGKAASLNYSEPLLIRQDGKISIVKIGEFIDKFYQHSESGLKPLDLEIEALSMNSDFKLMWKSIRGIFRHNVFDKLLKIKLETGRNVCVTKDHSIFSIEKGKIVCKNSSELKKDDYVVIPKTISINDNICEINRDLARFLGYFIAEGHLYNKDGSYKIQFTLNKKECDIIDDIKDITLRHLSGKFEVCNHGENGVRLTIYGKESYLKLVSLLGDISHKKAKEKRIPNIIFNSNQDCRNEFFNSYMKGDAGVTKSIELISDLLYLKLMNSEVVSFHEREENVKTFLNDGRVIQGYRKRYDLINFVRNKKFMNKKVNFPVDCLGPNLKYYFKKKMLQGYSRVDCDDVCKKIEFDRILKFNSGELSREKLVEIYGKSSIEYFRKHDDLFYYQNLDGKVLFSLTEKGQVIADEIKFFKKVIDSDICIVQIKEILEIESKNDYVYDISIENDENFIAGFGGIVCHNTGAGITATVVKDEFLKGWALEAGAMVLANKGIVCIDEIEKMDATDRSAMHEALEQQTVTISKANVQATLQAQTSVLAAGNPKYGRFEPSQSITEQIDLPPALINRFDLIFVQRDLPNKANDDAIATHVLNMHQRKDKKPDISTELFKKYVAYAKQKVFPALTDEAVNEIKNFYVRMRNMPQVGDMSTIAISARQLQGLVRLAEAHAKSRLSLTVDKLDAEVSIRLTTYYLMQVGYDPDTKRFDIDRFSSKTSSSQRGKLIIVRETIKKLEEIHGKQIPIDVLRQELGKNISDSEFEDSLAKLEKSGDIFHPKPGLVQDVNSR